MVGYNKKYNEMIWINHGEKYGFELSNIIENSSSIFIASIELIEKKAIDFSLGDTKLPITWEIKVKVSPKKVIKNKKPVEFIWVGRYRPNHPDPMKEDVFWEVWLEENQEVIIFLSKNQEGIFNAEFYLENRVIDLHKKIN